MTDCSDVLIRALTSRRNRRGAAQTIAAAVGGLFLVKAGTNRFNPLALAQDDADDDSSDRGRGRGRGRGGDDDREDNSGRGNAEDREEEELRAVEIPAGSIEVRIVGDDAGDFVPGELTVDLGQAVTFVNVHSDEHTATGSGFDTGIIPDEGGTATVVLDTPGVFPYACLIHPEMIGTVSVRDANGVVPQTEMASQDVPAGATTVSITNLAFNPATVTVPTGTTVAWVNDDSVPHTVTASDGLFDSGIFDPGAAFAFAFNEPGSFAYLCQLHPQMQGTVIVEGEAVADDTQAGAPTTEATPAPQQAQQPAAPSDAAVSIVDFAFEPPQLEVAAGATVVWTNDGLAPHTVTGDFAGSGVLEPGQTFSQTFDAEGTFDYVCAIHPEMAGTVIVGADAGAPAAPEESPGPESTALEGVWVLELMPEDDALLAGQHALMRFQSGGMVEASFAATGDSSFIIGSGHGEWVVRDGACRVVLVALMTDANQQYVGTLTLRGDGQLAEDGLALEGTFAFEIASADTVGRGSGTFRGEPVPLEP